MNWGTYITITFIAFAIFMISLVVGTFRANTDLVYDDYYKKELEFQQQINKTDNFSKTNKNILVHQTSDGIKIAFPTEMVKNITEGTIRVYRPSDAKLDKEFPLALNEDGTQFVAADFKSGMYKVKFDWKSDKEYYTEKTIFIQ
ncbi:MAG: FixH family protein [Cytophagaceae bacterium]